MIYALQHMLFQNLQLLGRLQSMNLLEQPTNQANDAVNCLKLSYKYYTIPHCSLLTKTTKICIKLTNYTHYEFLWHSYLTVTFYAVMQATAKTTSQEQVYKVTHINSVCLKTTEHRRMLL